MNKEGWFLWGLVLGMLGLTLTLSVFGGCA